MAYSVVKQLLHKDGTAAQLNVVARCAGGLK